jgi:hypothetical protein
MKWSPTDLPRLRDETLQWVARHGAQLYANFIVDGRQEIKPDLPTPEAGLAMARAEAWRIANAELFHVTEHMTELVKTAADSLPEFTLVPEDLPAPCGFILFDEPVYIVDYDEGAAPVVAIVWGPWQNSPWPDGGVWATTYTDSNALIANRKASGGITEQEAIHLRANNPPLLLDNEGQIPFSADPILEDPRGEVEERQGRVLRILRSTWLLMGQSVATVENAEFDRAARKRYRREGKEPPTVRVISLRKPATGGAGEPGNREYHHRWIVRGHWRKQWYASVNDHRPVWIAPYVKGPEGAPLIGGERVYSLRE